MSKKPLKVIAGAPDRPLIIGDVEIPCYVLEDETRVLTQSGFLEAIGRSRPRSAGTGVKSSIDKLPHFLRAANLKPFISKELSRSVSPLRFIPPAGGRGATERRGGRGAIGYDAKSLPQVCEVYLKARDARALLPNQMHIAAQSDILMRGLATVGVIALVDEATGYQRIREERALSTILEKFIAKELQPWTKTFPYEFYEQIFRLKGWPGPDGAKRPSVIGHYTNDIVYDRLPHGVLDELRRINPKMPSGRRKHKHHQWFTPDIGHSKLKEHLAAVMAVMRISPNWDRFTANLNRAFQKPGQTKEMPFDDEQH